MKQRMGFVAAALALAVLLAGCGGGGTETADSPTPSITGPKVDAKDFAFAPKDITIKAGETLTWVFVGPTQHDATSDDGTTFKSGTKDKDTTFAHTFASAGTFKYKCTIHPTMTGTVTVTA